jgi:hypothetical protein
LPRFEWGPNRYIKQNQPCLLNIDPVVDLPPPQGG